MKSIVIKICVMLAILILLFSINAKVFAWSDIIQDGQSFLSSADDTSTKQINQDNLKTLSGFLYNVLLSAGVVIAVIVAVVLGIQFMIGGAEGQAKVKEMLIPFVVGCVIVFGGFGIWKLALTIGNKVDSSVGTSADSTTYTRTDDGTLYCDNCGDKLTMSEQHHGQCSNCGHYIQGI